MHINFSLHRLISFMIFFGLGILAISNKAYADSGHSEPFAQPLLWLVIILALALLGKLGAQLFKQSAVLGELLIGMIAGNLFVYFQNDIGTMLANIDLVNDPIKLAQFPLNAAHFEMNSKVVHFLNNLGQLGVLFLMFSVGLENNVKDMMKVGFSAFKVAIVGVILPMILGIGVTYLVVPNATFVIALFVGSSLCATSVGITARVIKDLNLSSLSETKIILGAAVIDDVLGLIVLAMATSIAQQGSLNTEALYLLVNVLIFLGVSIVLLPMILNWAMPRISRMLNSQIVLALLVCFGFSVLSAQIGLAMIVGAFLAGLLLDDSHFNEGDHIHHMIAPFEAKLAPIFFVLMGFQVKFDVFLDGQNLILMGLITVVAIIGKILAGYVVSAKLNRLAIGLGIVPRGEVGLIFVGMGKTLGVFDDKIFGAVVGMIIITTLLTPIFLSKALTTETV